MNKDTRSTVIGIAVACAIQGLTYAQEGVDVSSPLWWTGLVGSCISVIKGYYHNKPEPPAVEPPNIHPKPPTVTVTEEGPFIHPKPPEG